MVVVVECFAIVFLHGHYSHLESNLVMTIFPNYARIRSRASIESSRIPETGRKGNEVSYAFGIYSIWRFTQIIHPRHREGVCVLIPFVVRSRRARRNFRENVSERVGKRTASWCDHYCCCCCCPSCHIIARMYGFRGVKTLHQATALARWPASCSFQLAAPTKPYASRERLFRGWFWR